jgi:Tfp pilus assembly protein PilN
MSVKVNLLPAEASARQAVARQRNGVIAGGVAVLAVLGAVTVWQNGRVADAEERLAGEQQVLAALQTEVDQLGEFADLEQRVAQSDTLIVQALGAESSFAGMLQDIAAVMPSDAQLETLNITLDPAGATADGTESASLGTMQAVGKSLNAHAPGLERLLLELDKVAAFHDLFFTSSVLEEVEDPYPTFTVEAQIGPETLTGRYLDGVPEDLR